MFLGNVFVKNAKNDPKTSFSPSKSEENEKKQKIIGMRRNDVKSGRFRHPNGPLKVIFEDIDFKLGTHIYRTSMYHIYSGFLKKSEIF